MNTKYKFILHIKYQLDREKLLEQIKEFLETKELISDDTRILNLTFEVYEKK
jgi:hypothetical protein